jgi:hypothetical protein
MQEKLSWTTSIILASILWSTSGCTMLYHEREKVLITDIDIDQTLEIAALELEENKMSSVLTVWAMRDQVISPAQAGKVSELYFSHIDRIDSEDQKARMFSVWHLTWAISNMYRLGDDSVKGVLRSAYLDAAKRVDSLDSRIASTHFYDEKIVMGDAHFGGRRYARKHLVVPGNKKYVQSVEEYKKDNEYN